VEQNLFDSLIGKTCKKGDRRQETADRREQATKGRL
jgi:hypothetical protein